MTLTDFLADFGLTKTESVVYLQALEYPHVSPAEIARLTKLKRPTVYHALHTLEQKGLVATIGTARAARYKAERPEQLRVLLERRVVECEKLENKLDKVIDTFPSFQSDAPQMQGVEYFHGLDALKNLGERVYASKTKEVFGLAPSFQLIEQKITDEYALKYLDGRAKRGIVTKSIWQDMPTNLSVADHEQLKRELRIAPVEEFGEFRTIIEIYDNSVVLMNVLPEFFGVHITSFAYAETMRHMWRGIWERAHPVE